MLQTLLNVALKEWAVVQRSLLEQHQIILVRKGGIAEETGDFGLKAKQFVLLAGYEHETERRGDIQPCFDQWLREEEDKHPPQGQIRIECACEVEAAIQVLDREQLVALMPQHIWSRQFIDGRYEWEPYKPVTALLVRAFRLPQPAFLPYRREYGGCRSWVTLETAIDTSGSVPAIAADETFRRRLDLTSGLLMKQAMTNK
jgi:hypothetical protein